MALSTCGTSALDPAILHVARGIALYQPEEVALREVVFWAVAFGDVLLRLADLRAEDDLPVLMEREWDIFFATAARLEAGLLAEAAPPFTPAFLAEALFTVLPLPEPLFFPPPLILFTVAHARRSASSSDCPLCS
jgi:hypothetical protein